MSELFDEEFMDKLPSDPWLAFGTIAARFEEGARGAISLKDNYAKSVEALLIAKLYCAEYLRELKHFDFEPTVTDIENAIGQVESAFKAANDVVAARDATNSYEDMEARAAALVGKVNAIEFTDGDLKRIQVLIDEMRSIVTDTEEVEQRHRQRILDKLEGLQKSLHKRMTKADEVWLLLPAVGLSLGQFGKNAAPLWDRLNETLRIFVSNEARQAQLPSDFKPNFLPNPNLESDNDNHESDVD